MLPFMTDFIIFSLNEENRTQKRVLLENGHCSLIFRYTFASLVSLDLGLDSIS